MIRAALLVVLTAGAAQPAGWQDFYRPIPRPGSDLAVDAVCLREILDAQDRYDIPENILLAIGLQEAGIQREGVLTVWPWSVNAEGEGRIFESREDAMDWVSARQAENMRSIDVGCMQVNLHWHPKAFGSLDDGFDPVVNVDYAARFLRDLYFQTGDWELAAGSYHSFTPELRKKYLAALRQNKAAANARIDEFRAVAATVRRVEDAPERGGILWSSEVSQLMEGSEGTRSVYSDRALQPLLPQFLVAD